MKFLKSHWSNILFLILILLLLLPQTRKPIQVGLNRLISFSPSEISEEKRKTLNNYNWRLHNINDGLVDVKGSKGEVIIINLWATWCPPCIAELPAFQSLYEEYKNNVDFYFISSEEKEQLQKFMKNKGYEFPVFQPISAAPDLLKSNSLPTTYVISRKGEIVVQKTGAADWNSSAFHDLLDKLLSE